MSSHFAGTGERNDLHVKIRGPGCHQFLNGLSGIQFKVTGCILVSSAIIEFPDLRRGIVAMSGPTDAGTVSEYGEATDIVVIILGGCFNIGVRLVEKNPDIMTLHRLSQTLNAHFRTVMPRQYVGFSRPRLQNGIYSAPFPKIPDSDRSP